MSAVLMTNVDKKLLRTTKFPPEFDKKVDMEKVNVPVIKKWVADEIARILNSDDDIVAELVYNVLEEARYPKIKELQILITGFLDKDAPKFSKDLWKLLMSAQNGAKGVPQELLEAKKQELEQQQVEEEKAKQEAIKRQQAEQERERELARTRDRERNNRRGRGGFGGRDSDRRPAYRDSRSPPPRTREDRYRAASPTRGIDSYIPGRGQRDDRPRRRRSPSYHRSPTRSPPPRPRRRRHSSASKSRSRSPPRQVRKNSDEADRSVDVKEKSQKHRGSSRDSHSRSPIRKRRSRSPRRRPEIHRRRRSPSYSDRSRSPPRKKRSRRDSPSRSRSPPPHRRRNSSSTRPRSRTPPRRSEKHKEKKDLLGKPDRRDKRRLSPGRLSVASSRSETPQQKAGSSVDDK